MSSRTSRLLFPIAVLAVCFSAPPRIDAQETAPVSFRVTVATPPGEPLDGRLLLMLSSAEEGEPRFRVTDGPSAQPIFGIDVEGWDGRTPQVIDGSAFGFPVGSLSGLPAGTYTVQALLHRYETFSRADGHVVKMPMDRGEGQQWNRAPGNLYSTPARIQIDPAPAIRCSSTTGTFRTRSGASGRHHPIHI